MRKRLDTEEFAAIVAAPLKQEVTLDGDFEARVMRAVDEAARPWWQRRRSISFTPLGGFALAAAFGGLMVLAGVGVSRTLAPSPTVAAAAPADTVHIVRFVFTDAEAQSVSLAGDFNGWSRSALPLEPAGAGRWVVEVPLAPGRHEYAFIVDGERWVADPYALSLRDEFGQESSVVRVGDLMRGA